MSFCFRFSYHISIAISYGIHQNMVELIRARPREARTETTNRVQENRTNQSTVLMLRLFVILSLHSFLSVQIHCLSVCLSLSLSVSLSSVSVSVCLSLSLSLSLSFCLCLCLSFCVSVCLSLTVSVCLSVCLSLSVSVCLSLSLSLSQSVSDRLCVCVCVCVCVRAYVRVTVCLASASFCARTVGLQRQHLGNCFKPPF